MGYVRAIGQFVRILW